MQAFVLSFPPFRLDVADERLWRDGTELKLRRKPFAILKYLAMHPRRLVTPKRSSSMPSGQGRDSESLLRTHVRAVRQALGDDTLIETVTRRGYRFLSDVHEVHQDAVRSTTPGHRCDVTPALSVEAMSSGSCGPTWRRPSMVGGKWFL